jgi:hypothetical protein
VVRTLQQLPLRYPKVQAKDRERFDEMRTLLEGEAGD